MENEGDEDFLTRSARELMGVSYLFPYQRLVVANLLEAARAAGIGVDGAPEGLGREDAAGLGRQAVVLPTGAGKSLCFQLPALMLEKPTLVVYPILSLLADQERRLKERGFAPALLRGGQTAEERGKAWGLLESGEARIAISNPETLLAGAVLGRLKDAGFAHLVLDEAHCVSEWGESFRPSYLRIAEIAEACGAPLLTAFTATASPAVLDKMDRYVFGGLPARRVLADPDRPNIRYEARGSLRKNRSAVELACALERPAIVFCSSRHGTERLARDLRAERPDLDVRFYHAGLEREEKTAVEAWFFGSPDGILTATCAYGMGVDKSDIRTVMHLDPPPTVEAYLQESGRAGRDGKDAKALLLWGPGDGADLERRARKDGKAVDAEAAARAGALLAYARDAGRCRREALLALLGAPCPACSGCDVCAGEASSVCREEAALIGFVGRNRRRCGLGEASRLVAAGRNALLGRLPDGRPAGGAWTDDDARAALRVLLAEGKIRTLGGPFWKGKLSLGKEI